MPTADGSIAPFRVDQSTESPLSPLTDYDSDFEMFPPAVLPAPSEVICINTAFDPKDDKNIKVDYRTGKARDRYFATQKQRKPAQAAEAAISIEDLQAKVYHLF
jgi:hypothetical protein